MTSHTTLEYKGKPVSTYQGIITKLKFSPRHGTRKRNAPKHWNAALTIRTPNISIVCSAIVTEEMKQTLTLFCEAHEGKELEVVRHGMSTIIVVSDSVSLPAFRANAYVGRPAVDLPLSLTLEETDDPA